MLSSGTILDGYRLIRPVGQGGFGEVWLCVGEVAGDYRALKFVAENRPEYFAKEFEALARYRRVSTQLRSPHLMPIEHVNRNAAGIFYVMPLADGDGADSPEDPQWKPYTLAAHIEQRRAGGDWFTCNEIADTFSPILEALQLLSANGLVHRDVKPENILRVAGRPCLGDISLLGEDKTRLTQCGTPGYMTPSWYAGGHADMFGAALTLYMLLTGNLPDKYGRANFRGPPCGNKKFAPAEQHERERFHRAIARALDERPSERFPDFATFRRSLQRPASPAKARVNAPRKSAFARIARIGFAATCVAGAGLGGFFAYENFPEKAPRPNTASPLQSAGGEFPFEDYGDIALAIRDNNARLERCLATLLTRGEKISETSPMLTLAEKFYAARVKADASGTLPATPSSEQLASCLKLAAFRINEQLFSQAKARATTPEKREFFDKNVAPVLRKEGAIS